MATLTLLGTGAAFSDPHRTTTMLALSQPGSTLLVDCGGDVIQRAMATGVPLEEIEGLIVTHEHADHAGGFPLFMEKIWLSGRSRPIPVYGIAPALAQARRAWESFDTERWQGVPEILWREVPLEPGATLLEDELWRVHVAPGRHSVPVVGLRVEARDGRVVAYSCDTAPSDEIAALAHDADILVHEATGEGHGHSSAAQAAQIAARARARRLILIHLPPADRLDLDAARERFTPVEVGEEGGRYDF